MNLKYLGIVLFLFTPHIAQTMHVNLTSIIVFNGEEKSLYEWIRYDKNKKFGHTPLIDLRNKAGYEPHDHYYRTNRLYAITTEQLKDIAAGHYIYCKNLKIKTLKSGKKINYGALAYAFCKTDHFNSNKTIYHSLSYDVSRKITEVTLENLNFESKRAGSFLQEDYLKKLLFPENAENNNNTKAHKKII